MSVKVIVTKNKLFGILEKFPCMKQRNEYMQQFTIKIVQVEIKKIFKSKNYLF